MVRRNMICPDAKCETLKCPHKGHHTKVIGCDGMLHAKPPCPACVIVEKKKGANEMKRKATMMICPSTYCSAPGESCDHRRKHKKNKICNQGVNCPDCVKAKRKEKKA
jgi:hypothetical protein